MKNLQGPAYPAPLSRLLYQLVQLLFRRRLGDARYYGGRSHRWSHRYSVAGAVPASAFNPGSGAAVAARSSLLQPTTENASMATAIATRYLHIRFISLNLLIEQF